MKLIHPTHFANRLVRFAIPLIAFAQIGSAAVVFTEDFEGGTNAFGLPTYGYNENYTLANSLTPAAGSRYAHGGNPAGAGEVMFEVSFSAPELSLTELGYTNEMVDSGTLNLTLAAQFSTYQSQNDFAIVSVQFLDALGGNLGSPIEIGGSDFVSTLSGGTGSRGWDTDSLESAIPVGARSMLLSVSENKTPQGAYIDGYVDNVTVSIVPEPSAIFLCIAGLLPWFFRRQR
ncbi:hypothetical protein JIN85_08990 [Luteolibacter pohnpeiensis]|uniref:PEP-CTERM protein-sorting domain-containing protein n=1 Tax=Luteolibacter pohnpeiensis TaxID=454153 RepID=A0A934S3L3_9BACT|nr:hypothetical protein [Luteolibacter pohnpeiensis]MBK1882550.1 hypothetical protein [Luteolibacter pohnpeiensis]